MVDDLPEVPDQTAPNDVEYDVLAPWGPSGPPPSGLWVPDILGTPYSCRTLELLDDEEGPVVATLVRKTRHNPRFILLYLHGRNDYFFQTELSETIDHSGGAFYALDLRKYGRSLRPWQTIGYIDDLSAYDEDISAALDLIRLDHPDLPLIVMGHSTGGLIAALWAYRHPGACTGLILNSAWLDLQKYASMKPALKGVLDRVAARSPHAPVIGAGSDTYSRSLSGGWEQSGFPLPERLEAYRDDPAVRGWVYAPEWKRPDSYPVPAAWLAAVIRGQEEIEKNAHIDCPVLSMTSTRSVLDEKWSPDVFSSDIVLDVNAIRKRAVNLSDCVTMARLPGKHDLATSDPDVRADYYAIITRWLRAVCP